jgi:hypothetical protein
MATEQQKANKAYLKMRAEYRAKRADKPLIIKDEDFADIANGLLKGPNLKGGLNVYIPLWDIMPPATRTETIKVMLDRGTGTFEEVASHDFTIPAGKTAFPEHFPFNVLIGVNDLPDDASCQLKYVHFTYQGDEIDSPITSVICDRLPPYKHVPPPELAFPDEFLDDDNLPPGGNLTVPIKGYPDWKVGDKIAIYLVDAAKIPDDPTAADLVYFNNVPSPGTADQTVLIPASTVRDYGDAECVFLYVLIDAAQNPSAVSVHKKISLTFGLLPENLIKPRVPQANPVLLNEHVRAGVSIWIDKYDNWKAGDKIRARWGGTVLEPDVDFRGMGSEEVKVLPAELMLTEYGQHTTGPKTTPVSYQIIRKGRPFGPLADNFQVNFEVPIPWLPWPGDDWPEPVHPDLKEGVVKNHDDSKTNELVRADQNEDATFTFQWYDAAINDDVVDFFWSGQRVVEAQVIFDDSIHNPGDDFTADILWKYIKDGGNGDPIPVHYQVSRSGVENPLHSATTNVKVNAIAIELPAASFPTIPVPDSYPGCGVLDQDGSLRVAIPDVTGLLNDGDVIRVGAYTTWLDAQSGYYFDAVLKYNRFQNDSKVQMSDGQTTKGDYDTHGMGASLEFGRHIKLADDYFVEPYAQLSGVVIDGASYDLDNGMNADGDRADSLLGKVGATVGRNITWAPGKTLQPYLRAAYVHEFATRSDVEVNDNRFSTDLSGSRGELGAGVAMSMTDKVSMHVDLEYSNGDKIEQPWGANFGIRYSW